MKSIFLSMFYKKIKTGLVVATSAALTIPACGTDEKAPLSIQEETSRSIETLVGTWVSELSYGGSTERFELRLEPGDTHTVARAYISIPAIDLWDYSIGAATASGQMVQAGSLQLRHEADGPRLVGFVPGSFAPLQRIALDLRPADAIERPAGIPSLPSPEVLWRFETGGPIWAGATIADGTVFAGSDDGNAYAFDLRGRELWRFTTGAPVRAAPVVSQKTVLIHSDDGFVYRLAADSGELMWKAELAERPLRRLAYGSAGFRYDHYASRPTISAGTVYVGHERTVHALDLGTGAARWTKVLPDTTTSSPVVAAGRLFLGSFDGIVHALDAASGSEVWTHDTGAPVPGSAAVYDALVIVGSRSYELLALDVADGTTAWSFYNWFSWVESSPTLAGGTVYIGSSDGQHLNAIDIDMDMDARDGSLVWQFDTNGSAWAQPAVSDSAVFIGAVGVAGYIVDHRGGFFAVDRDTGDGLWELRSAQPEDAALWGFGASAAVGEGIVVVGGLDGALYALRAPP